VEFDFLPQLPKSDLDDRNFKDLVDECLLRIPRYCPEWTNHNPSDPGVTLIELFAWLTDQMLLRFNQVPRRNYVAFLELLGMQLQPPAPAKTVLSFYLTRYQDGQRSIPAIPKSTEVATERTETEPAIVFSTQRELPLGLPRINYFLTEEAAGEQPEQVRDRLTTQWSRDSQGAWSGDLQWVFQQQPRSGDCFYLVFDGSEPLDGNIIQLTISGEPAGSTGINPHKPPRRWEAWNGQAWEPVLLREDDDGTRGFSFDNVERATRADQCEADIRLHLPLNWEPVTFSGYYGRWLRCCCDHSGPDHFSRSPRISALFAQTIGGRTPAYQCSHVFNELVGESDGNPGQTFYLQSQGILVREAAEYLQVTPVGEPPQRWQEVENFAYSGPGDRHYTLDSRTGRIQFGPLIREPQQLREEVQLRREVQWQAVTAEAVRQTETLEQQYGLVPPRGALLQMVAYRTGGGDRGNVPKQSLQILKTALPYIKSVTNPTPGQEGANAESLEEAVLRVPRMLRTRDRAVTAEDYETLTLQASRAVGRAYCPRVQPGNPPGTATVYVVPRVALPTLERGIAPQEFDLSPSLRQEITGYLGDRCLLGTQLELRQPDYVGISVQAVLGVGRDYQLEAHRESLLRQVNRTLYEFLNPLTGGQSGRGWEMGMPLYQSDIVKLLQTLVGVQFIDTLQLFELRRANNWRGQPVSTGVIDPGPTGVICSWSDAWPDAWPDDRRPSAHRIQLLSGEAL
jgi:predicted phage baseplate assembly protein